MSIAWAERKLPECEGCTLRDQPGPVMGDGDPRTTLIIINAQNPGWHECFNEDGSVRSPMKPLVGPSGRIFNRQLFEAYVKREECYITNQVKCLTPNNRPPTQLEINKCKHIFQKELQRCRADTVVLLGSISFKENIGNYSTISPMYHPTNKKKQPLGVMERMGCVEVKDGRKWLGSIHPAFIMRMNMFMEEANDFLSKAWRISGVEIPKIDINVRPTDADVVDYAREAVSNGSFADDVETTQLDIPDDEDDYIGGDWAVTMYGVSCRPYHAMVMEPEQIPLFAEIAWKETEVYQYEHNMEYEGYYLPRYGTLRNRRFDTMLAHHWLYNTSRKYLKPHCVRRYTNLPYYGRDLGRLDERVYNGLDCITTYLTGREQTRLLRKEGLWELIWQYGFPMLPILEGWRREGINVDVRKALFFKKICGTKVEQVENLLGQMLGPMFNWNSPKQVAELFYDKWKLPVQYNKKDNIKKVTVDNNARESLGKWINASTERKEQYKQASICFQLLDYAHEFKNLADYFNRISPDGRIHAFWKAHGAETFRLASKPNVQNWPTWSIGKTSEGVDLGSPRSVVIPDHEDDVLISTDFEQFELWAYAKIWNIQELLKVYEKGEYIHGIAYEDTFKRPFFTPGARKIKANKLSTVTEEDLLRAKAVPLGFQYGRTGESLAAEKGWPSSEGVAYRTAWFKKYPEYPISHAKIKYEMTQQKRLRPPPGLLLHYPVPQLQGINCFGQTPTAMILCESIIMIERELKRRALPHARTVLCVHDSTLTNCRRSDADEVLNDILTPILTRPISWLDDFRFRIESKIGTMWDWEMKGYDEWKLKFGGPIKLVETQNLS